MRSYLTTLGSLAAVGVMLSAFSCGSDSPKTTQVPSVGPTDPDLAAARAALASTPLGRVVSRDVRGAGRLVMASSVAGAPRLNLGHETVSRLHFERHAAVLGVSDSVVQSAVFKGWHAMPTGAGVAQFEHRIGDIEIFRARTSVLVDSSNQLVSIASTAPGANIKRWNKSTSFKQSAEDALASAYSVHAGIPLRASSVRDQGAVEGTALRNYAVEAPTGGMQVLSATAKRVLFPTGDRLQPAFYVEILGRTGLGENDARGFVIAADDGRVLQQDSLTHNDAFNYRVWADPMTKVPLDGPIADMTPHPTGLPDNKAQTLIDGVVISMEGFNKNPNSAADPWLAADATFTWGNNVRAYSDRNQGTNDAGAAINNGYQDGGPDGGGDYRADLTGTKTFDRVYNHAQNPDSSPDQIKAAITQLFYVNNWLHDYWYDSGFNEAANNAQADNFGRGGMGNDPLLAEAQDSADNGQANNANMSSMSDGTSPRMQMYVWTGLPNRKLEVPTLTFTDPIGAASFGPQIFDETGTAILSDDMSTALPPGTTGTGTVTDGCQPIMNVSGQIAVIDRGVCNYVVKVQNAMMGGAKGVIIINNVAGNVAPNPPGVLATTLPLLALSKEDGDKLKTALAAAGTTGIPTTHMWRGVEIMRDGTIDNTIVAHEWGHYWHHRLVNCSGQSCGGMSEGWGDFMAVMMTLKDGDVFDGGKTYAMAQYATGGFSKDGSYYGIRRAPYSRDKTKNPFTFGHVRQVSMLPTGVPLAPTGADMSEVHNVGEVWTQTLFEAYTNLIDKLKTATPPVAFDEIRRRMADYLVAGLKATPANPTFVEQRDAILGAVLAIARTEPKRMDDFSALAQGFATRGLGVAAIAPPSTSTNLNEAVEDFSFKGALDFVDAKLDDSGTSCDHDGILDPKEVGTLTVTVKNSGWLKLSKTQVTATSTDPNITFTASSAESGADMTTLDPYQSTTIKLTATAKEGIAKKSIPVTITMTDADAVKPSVAETIQVPVNFDDTKASSKTDDVESTLPPVWSMTPQLSVDAWTRKGDATNHVWHGDDMEDAGDERLESPPLLVSATEPFTMAFKHSFGFETCMIPGITGTSNCDGGVVEVAEVSADAGADAGADWQDVSTYVDPMYPGTIVSTLPIGAPDDNALAGRKGFVGKSAADVDTKLDFGMKLAGKTVKVRFRIGTDQGNSTTVTGWDIDNIAFTGITNSPFAKVGDNAGVCTTGDGGTTTDAGAKPDSGTGGAGGTGGSTGTGGTGSTDDSCSCSVPGGRSGSGTAAVGVFGALAMLLRGRRRRQQG